MPTSTPWRGRQSDDTDLALSPTRPSDDSVERLSPAPFLTIHTSHHDSAKRNIQEQQLFGLGLSSSSSLNGALSVTQPDHLYFDSDGGAHVGAKARSSNKRSNRSDIRSREGKNSESRSNRSSARYSKSKGHTRSGSTIDDLANVAIATSPTFDSGSPTFSFSTRSPAAGVSRPATSYIDGYNSGDRSFDRPAKRVRSEKLHSMEWSPRGDRPRTSHAFPPQTSMEEAELLLGLRHGYSFSTNTSPVCASISTFQPLEPVEMVSIPVPEPELESKPEPEPEPELEIVIAEVALGQIDEDTVMHTEEELPVAATGQATHVDALANSDKMDIDIQQHPSPGNSSPIVRDSAIVQARSEEVAEKDENNMQGPSDENTKPTIEPPPAPAPTAKKPRKIKPEIQAEVCAACQRLQRDNNGEDTTTQWICCDYCSKWFHLACGGFKDKSETRAIDKFVCKDCEPQYGQTTFVRKSSRVRTAIDYAGLNEGLVKSSEESSTHHYIQPIKDGMIKIQPDDFARVRPELLTSEFWENMDNIKRPFVVPACWNPRFGVPHSREGSNEDRIENEPALESPFVCDSHGNQIGRSQLPKPTSSDVDIDDATEEIVVDCDQDYLDMVMPRNLTVRRVAELYGPEQPVPVIDVKSQETKGQWTLSEWADYYEKKGEKPIRNVISLEVSNSPIGKLIRRPRAVREIDLEDFVWDNETRTANNKRPVQFYCLMSVADSYTDFHIDFGGSSVYYHILKGVKTFFFIPPEEKYLKEYEKWCNSDTQNDTWLGDLCNGNVTRVDLHEGDTAFIPAGWIHSVWTPEDSLVIGGNFLTRLDYDLQLRVANIEKVTKVPQKFRYPFFQKVMWYALLKYLEDDPVPEEVLRDFYVDEDYRYLRANPIWHEQGEFANNAEPGEPSYNVRMYPKSEINGLSALRDYLYRTACIHADIPVPDINKKQIDAVKASIPKGHGDPMRLIKTFAVWCAWKMGNETVPRWVHDQGDGLNSEIKERERVREETFRVPPERVSARNASKTKADSPAVETITTPAKTAVNSGTVDDVSSAKSRSGSRGGSLRVACDACRKRRIKCRHKEGDDTATNSSPPEIRPRTYSNVSVDIPKLASASPVSSSFEQSSTMNGLVSDFSSTSDLAQAALATLHSQSSDPNQATAVTPSGGSAKKGRSKACEECRKSKRRCVHDEYGRIDPAKAAEPSKPRGSTTTKRQTRTSDDFPSKRHRLDSETEQVNDIPDVLDPDSLIDPALLDDGFSINVIHPPTESIVTHHEPDSEVAQLRNSSFALLDPDLAESTIKTEHKDRDELTYQDVSDREEVRAQLHIATGENIANGPSLLPAHLRQSPDIDISYSPITVDGNITESTEKPDVKMEDAEHAGPVSRHSSRQPKQVDRYVPEDYRSPSKLPSKSSREHRASNSSEHTLEVSVSSRRSSSNTSGTTHQAIVVQPKPRQSNEVNVRPVSRASSAGSDMDADEKLARELQAAENGLRRRASMRA